MRLVEHLKEKELRDRSGLIARYRKLLEVGDSPTHEQVAEIMEIAAKLGFDSDRIGKDADAIVARRRLQKVASEEGDRLKTAEAARAEHAKVCAEVKAALEEGQRKIDILAGKKDHAEMALGASRSAARQLAELNAANQELFGLTESEIVRGSEAALRIAR
jgi:hypothetical protein